MITAEEALKLVEESQKERENLGVPDDMKMEVEGIIVSAARREERFTSLNIQSRYVVAIAKWLRGLGYQVGPYNNSPAGQILKISW